MEHGCVWNIRILERGGCVWNVRGGSGYFGLWVGFFVEVRNGF